MYYHYYNIFNLVSILHQIYTHKEDLNLDINLCNMFDFLNTEQQCIGFLIDTHSMEDMYWSYRNKHNEDHMDNQHCNHNLNLLDYTILSSKLVPHHKEEKQQADSKSSHNCINFHMSLSQGNRRGLRHNQNSLNKEIQDDNLRFLSRDNFHHHNIPSRQDKQELQMYYVNKGKYLSTSMILLLSLSNKWYQQQDIHWFNSQKEESHIICLDEYRCHLDNIWSLLS